MTVRSMLPMLPQRELILFALDGQMLGVRASCQASDIAQKHRPVVFSVEVAGVSMLNLKNSKENKREEKKKKMREKRWMHR